MIIYVQNTSNVVMGIKDDLNEFIPSGCTEVTVDQVPFYMGPELYTYDTEFELTETGTKYFQELNIPPDIYFTEPVEMKIQRDLPKLWKAAKKYQEIQLDSMGYIEMKDKASNGGTKAQANVDWVQGIWSDYYSRKSLLLLNEIVSFDYSNNGDLPYNFYEALDE